MRLIDADYMLRMSENDRFIWVYDMTDLEEFLTHVPTIEAAPVVHGEWIKQKPDEEVMNAFHAMGIGKGMSAKSIYWICSECGGWGTPTHKFCPNCGAKMRTK